MPFVLLVLGVAVSSSLMASDTWICTEEASQRSGNTINACGIGKGADEDTARANAFNAAKAEFSRVCKNSSDCINHSFKATPMRTTCDKSDKGFTCYRMVSFEIGESFATIQKAQNQKPACHCTNDKRDCVPGNQNYFLQFTIYLVPNLIGNIVTGHDILDCGV